MQFLEIQKEHKVVHIGLVVGSSFLILVWLYYSWDIAKGFYPKSANELCQVAKSK